MAHERAVKTAPQGAHWIRWGILGAVILLIGTLPMAVVSRRSFWLRALPHAAPGFAG